MNLYVGLVHHPIVNKRGDLVTTSVTNLDIHDISRSCRTFNVKQYFLVTPLKAQHQLVSRIIGHWEGDKATQYNPDRVDALSVARLVNSVDEALLKIKDIEGHEPILAMTGANFESYDGTPQTLKNKMMLDKRACFLLFGTGWGLHASLTNRSDFKLAPILGTSQDRYNHLSVRSAVAIYLAKFAEASES